MSVLSASKGEVVVRVVKVSFLSLFTFEISFAIVWMIVGVSWIVSGDDLLLKSSVGAAINPGWRYLWATLYLIGAPLGLVGMYKRDARLRVAGLIFLTSGLLANGIAAITLTPELRDLTFFVWAGAGIARIVDLVRGKTRG